MSTLTVKYNGPSIFLYNDYNVNDLEVTIEESRLNVNEFKVSSTTINKIGLNYFTVTELRTGTNKTAQFYVIGTKHIAGMLSTVTVSYIDPKILRLRCWYEGVKIEVGNPFDKHDVIAYMIDENGYAFKIDVNDIEFIDDVIIYEDGWNFYRLKLNNPKYGEIIGTYAVPGYTPLEIHEDVEFKVVYVDERNNSRELDYTEHFKKFLMFDDYLYIEWESVQQAIIELGIYGRYVLTIPKKCGLSNKYDQDWEVICTYRGAISASILKNHYKEENETWQQRKQLQQTRKKWWKVPNET